MEERSEEAVRDVRDERVVPEEGAAGGGEVKAFEDGEANPC